MASSSWQTRADRAIALVAASVAITSCASLQRGTAQICRTRGQAEARESIDEIIPLERAPDGSWRATRSA